MSCAPLTAIVGGAPAAGLPAGFDVFTWSFTTTDATPVVRQWGNLAVNGAGIAYEGRCQAVQDTGANGQYAFIGGLAGRNAAGTGQNNPVIGGTAWTPPGAPFATIAGPGWTMIMAQLTGNILEINMAGLAGQTVRWSGWIIRNFNGGATP